MTKRILILGATGMLGKPVTRCLVDKNHDVRVLVRSREKAQRLFANTVEIVEGSATDLEDLRRAMDAVDAVHISLTQDAELIAAQYVVDLAGENGLERVTYVSATTVREENRWFRLVDIKMRTEELLKRSGLPHIIFCPTWVMETLNNFIRGDRAVAIIGKNPPTLHFFAAADYGRMVAASYEDDRALGRRLFIHGPEGITLPDALERLVSTCYPELNLMRMKLWQAKLIARLTGREEMAAAIRLIAYFDRVGELGDPTKANNLLGAPTITLDEWFEKSRDVVRGLAH